ncbi:adenosylcobinamide-GDP ribazoletransferase [Roseomonas sp. NAR14]|uniref:Adenosylcobinamide-GDP ribazoletransferase n=1 Tax=Roseomonas acroporae TaxID=2937791 RepID=A0A9X2BYH9_9PROT|nr:adenosylcobinamide-GDP ribazoletransferase [Roseomonas acroporae]MCK8786045.1 adenosylcobinamide-GDP ribazoletransferase [Roseomonas acroporae]
MIPVLARRLAELGAAFGLLTRLPVGRLPLADAAGCARAVWAYPLAGAVAGAAGGAAFALASGLGIPPASGAVLALATMALVTGALHEDGLADTADGIGGGRTPERRLAIMRDSRIGSFGALALLLSLALRGTALAAMARPGDATTTQAGHVVLGLVAAAALGRGAMLLPLVLLPPARRDGLGASVGRPPRGAVGVGLALALLPALLLLPAGTALGAGLLAGLAGLAMARLAWRRLGGQTGDVLGATAVLAECAVLTLLAARAASSG